MTQAPEKTEKSPAPKSAPKSAPKAAAKPADPAAPPDPAVEVALQDRIAAARARVNALLAGLTLPPLPDWPLPDPADEARAKAEADALEYMELFGNPTLYRYCPPEIAASSVAGSIRAGLKSLAEARGTPIPDFSAEVRSRNPGGSVAREAAPEDEAARLARWEAKVRRVAGEHRGLLPLTEEPTPPDGWGHVSLPESYGPPAPKLARPAQSPDETEAELNGLISECRVLMRDVAMQSARFSCGVDDRVRFIESACRAAEAGATLGKMVARVRGATNSGQMSENRQRIIVERVERIPARLIAEGEGGA